MCLGVLLCLIASNSFGTAIGTSEPVPKIVTKPSAVDKSQNSNRSDNGLISSSSKIKLGFGTAINRTSVSDNIGQTNSAVSAQALSIYFSNYFIKDTRYLSEVHISNYGFEADETHIGQEVSQLGFRFSVQKKQRIVNNLSPWIGAGLGLSNSSFKKRHSVDSDGFLIEQYDNKTEPGFSVLLNVMEKWSLNSDLEIAAKIEYSLPVMQAVSRVSVGFILFFQSKL